MKKIIASLMVACLLAFAFADSVLAAPKVYLPPKYEKMAQAFLKKAIDSKTKFEDEGDYYNFLVSLEDQLKLYKAKNYSKIPSRNLANRLIGDIGKLRAEYEGDDSEDPDGLFANASSEGPSTWGADPKPADTIIGGSDPKPTTTGGPDPKPTTAPAPVTIPTKCLWRDVTYRVWGPGQPARGAEAQSNAWKVEYEEGVSIKEYPFTEKAYVYKFHTASKAYIASLALAHDSANAVSFISEKPCDYNAAADNHLIWNQYVSTSGYLLVSKPTDGLKAKWLTIADKANWGYAGYQYSFLDSDKDYYLTIVNAGIDRDAWIDQLTGNGIVDGWKNYIAAHPTMPSSCPTVDNGTTGTHGDCNYLVAQMSNLTNGETMDTNAFVPNLIDRVKCWPVQQDGTKWKWDGSKCIK